MPQCPKHKFEYNYYFRSGDIGLRADWKPKNERKAQHFYEISRSDDMGRMAEVMGEAQMVHSGESSRDSAFISVGRCPYCLYASKDPDLQAILKRYDYKLYIFEFPTGNVAKRPFIFSMDGDGIGASETECLVLLFPGTSLLDYWTGGVVSPDTD